MKHFLLLLPVLLALAASAEAISVVRLRCESRPNPLGIDTLQPRLSWMLNTDSLTARGLRQSAYQVLAATSPAVLARHQGDLWDSGQVKSDQSLHVVYAGKPLHPAQQVFWKVRVWDGIAKASAWSGVGQWTMGLLAPDDWHAQWIAAPGATSPRKSIGYHAGETRQQDDLKWVQVDLGKPTTIETVRLHPMNHVGVAGFGFPLRFKIEASNDADFQASTLLADQTAADFPNPGIIPVAFDGKDVTARFVRVMVPKLARHPTQAGNYAFALSQLEVVAGGRNVALNAPVTSKDSVEDFGWGKAGLTDGTLNAPDGAPGKNYSSLLLRKEFDVKPGMRRAIAFVCGLGQYEMTLNGAKVGSDLLAPGWTRYDKTCLYDTHDITSLLKPGANAVGLFLDNGMYNIPGGRYAKFKGSFGPLQVIGQIRLEYNDGTAQTLGTNGNWRVVPGPVTFGDPYGGEDYDARLEQRGWNQPHFAATDWIPATVTTGPGGELKGLSVANPPIHAFEVFKPVGTKVLNPNTTVYDMGQNAAIIPRLRVRGVAGAKVRLIPGELVKGDGSVDQGSSGGPSYWQYTLAGSGAETYFSPFFYRGCRYLQVETSAPENGALPVVESLETVAVHAASPPVGTFSCSNELFNRIYSLVRWAQVSNMVSVMTDCPHREKLGWLEEDHLNGSALRYNFDMSALFAKVMNDMADSQQPNGFVPTTAPEYPVFSGDFRDSPEWGSAFLLVAWQQYEFNGDAALLRRHYDGMKRYVAYLSSRAADHIVSYGLSDWYDIGPGEPGSSKLTPRGLTATAFYYQDAVIVAQTARMLGRADEAVQYEQLAEQIRQSFNAKFFNRTTNQYGSGSQAANSIPLVMGMVEPSHRAAVLENIVQDVQQKGLTAGDVGYRYLLRALADGGRSDVIYSMNNQSDKPGYGYQLKMGATSLTEAWDTNPRSSQNHFMLGQINEWFFHDLAGIQSDPAGPGFKKIIIKPAIVGDLTNVAATYDSDYGPIISHWQREGGKLTLDISIPANTTATIYLPAKDAADVSEDGKMAGQASGVKFLRMESGAAVYAVGSGRYAFATKVPSL